MGSDALLFDADMAAALARAFFRLTGNRVPCATLTALIVARRRRGEWIRLNGRWRGGPRLG